jgi:hypothetical protein
MPEQNSDAVLAHGGSALTINAHLWSPRIAPDVGEDQDALAAICEKYWRADELGAVLGHKMASQDTPTASA